MKTILISSFHQLISRNILSTPVLERLRESDVRCVILCPASKKEFFEREFNGRAEVRGVELQRSKKSPVLRYLALASLRTRSLAIKRKTELKGSGSLLSWLLNNPLGHRAVRFLSSAWSSRGLFAGVFDALNPSLVFSTDIQNDFDVELCFEAERRGIKTVGMVRAWDNLTSKGLVRFVPEKLLVHNNLIKKEAIELHHIKEENIEVIGIPHYDKYLKEKPDGRIVREKYGIGQDKRIVLVGPTGDRYISKNSVDSDIVKILDEGLSQEFHILVRLPPSDSVVSVETGNFSNRVSVDRPTTRFKTLKNSELSASDDEALIDILKESDVIVSGPTTLCLDALVVNKPAVLAIFDGKETRGYYDSVRRYFDYDHFRPVIESGAMYISISPDELVSMVKLAAESPEDKRTEKQNLLEIECFKLDGNSTDRLYDALIKSL